MFNFDNLSIPCMKIPMTPSILLKFQLNYSENFGVAGLDGTSAGKAAQESRFTPPFTTQTVESGEGMRWCGAAAGTPATLPPLLGWCRFS